MDLKQFSLIVNKFNIDNCDIQKFKDVFEFFKLEKNITVSTLEDLKNLTEQILKKTILTKRILTSDSDGQFELDKDYLNFYHKSAGVFRKLVKESDSKDIQETCLKALTSFLRFEANFTNPPQLPFNSYCEIITAVISSDHNSSSLVSVLEQTLTLQDTRALFWKATEKANCLKIKNLSSHNVETTVSLINYYYKIPKKLDKTLCGSFVKSDKKKQGGIIRKIWDKLITVKLDKEVEQMLLLCLIENLMTTIDNPISLTDYLMRTLNTGGAVSLISLQGLFNLIQKYNINYPNVYNKLYSMFDVDIFNLPYKERFYFLSDIFLSSLYLPQDMVAGFIKRICRLCLAAPPEDIVILMSFITNLLIRHPALSYMMNNDKDISLSSDPYDFDEPDPCKSRASESSLWEVKLLQDHVLPNVSSACMFANMPLPSVERDLSNLLEQTSSQIFDKETKKKMKEPPLNFERPSSLVSTDSPLSSWCL